MSHPFAPPNPAEPKLAEVGVAEPPPPRADPRLDAQDVAAVRAGDSSRFEELVVRHSPRLFGLARKYVRREADVADVVQEAFLRAFRRLDSWRGDAPFEHWLTRLAINCCYDHLRTVQRRPEDSLSDLTEDESAWMEHHGHSTHDDADSSAAARSLVGKILDQLSPASRMVIELLEIEERSMKEISALTGWNIPVIKIRAFRARAEMRRLLAKIDTHRYL